MLVARRYVDESPLSTPPLLPVEIPRTLQLRPSLEYSNRSLCCLTPMRAVNSSTSQHLPSSHDVARQKRAFLESAENKGKVLLWTPFSFRTPSDPFDSSESQKDCNRQLPRRLYDVSVRLRFFLLPGSLATPRTSTTLAAPAQSLLAGE